MGQAWYKDYLGAVPPSTGACSLLDRLEPTSMSGTYSASQDHRATILDDRARTARHSRLSSMASRGSWIMYIDLELDALMARVQLISYRYILL